MKYIQFIIKFAALAVVPGLIIFSTSSADAQAAVATTKTAETTIKNLADKAFAVLRDKNLKASERDQKFRALLREGFALEIIGNTVLGRNRSTTSSAQLQAFNNAFPDYVVRIYASRLTEYADTNIAIKGTTPVGNRGDVSVSTLVSGKNVSQPVAAVWRLRDVPGQGLKIIDLSIEGVSMVATQRDEFSSRIQAKGMDTLITEIRGVQPTATKK
jgi:phospholipid transport system substrate-binding protein